MARRRTDRVAFHPEWARVRLVLERDSRGPGPALADAETAATFLRAAIGQAAQECFVGLGLDGRYRVVGVWTAAIGGSESVEVPVGAVIRPALLLPSVSLVVAHNHPSDHVMPSPADRRLTGRLAAACRLVDLRLLDHVVVGTTGWYSFAMSDPAALKPQRVWDTAAR